MNLSKIILTSIFVLVTAFAAQAQSPSANEWSITDYFKNLPEKYKTFRGDFLPPSKDSTIIDKENGYAAYLNSPPAGTSSNSSQFPIFEMALFKSETKPPLVVVANLKSDSVCNEYVTFFLRRDRSDWSDAKSQVLPPLDLKMFWDAAQSVERILKIIKRNAISYQFEPPRRGTRMRVSLEICDYLEDDAPDGNARELEKLIASAKPIYLEWDKQNGKFKLAK